VDILRGRVAAGMEAEAIRANAQAVLKCSG